MDGLVFENSNLNENEESCEANAKCSQQEAIDFSNLLIGLLDDLSEDIPEVSTGDLRKVYTEAAHNCEIEKCPDINLWALARVNMFIRMKTQQEIKQVSQSSFSKPVNKITEIQLESPFFYESLQSVDITESWEPSQEDFDLAGQYSKKYDLQFIFSSVDELYIEEYKPMELEIYE